MSVQRVGAASGRDEQGRFAAGNPGGPGNTGARRVAHLRRLLLGRISDEDALAVFDRLVEMAKEGDLGAIKLVLQYTIGRPCSASELDAAFLADVVPQASGGREPPVLAAPQQGAHAPRSPSPSVPADLMRQIEDAIKMPPLVLPKAVSGRR